MENILFINQHLTPRLNGPPNDAIGRVRELMRFGRKACSASFMTSIGGPFEAHVKL